MQPESASAADYAQHFRCIGQACEDTCCQGWKIPVDPAAIDRYESLAASPLKSQIIAAIAPAVAPGPDSAPGCKLDSAQLPASGCAASSTSSAANMQPVLRMNADNRCTLLTAESLCSIHAQLGPDFLPSVCASYPRVQRQLGLVTETGLALSCPEAARLVLLGPSLLSPALLSRAVPSSSLLAFAPAPHSLAPASTCETLPYFADIRSTTLALITARNLPLWQRLFLLCLLCNRLDSIESGQLRANVPEYLASFRAGAASGALAQQMESMPFDPQAQLDAVLRLAGLMLHRSRVSPRFAECVAAFTAGIGNGPGANLETLTAAYTNAYRQWFAPFERSHPHVLENYLINLVVLQRFPFGRASDSSGDLKLSGSSATGSRISTPSKGREFARLSAQFALTRGLLIGVAGCHRDSFSPDHVVHTVQTVSRHFDHHPDFLSSAHALLAESRLDGIAGLSILLRNDPDGKPLSGSAPIYAPLREQPEAQTLSTNG